MELENGVKVSERQDRGLLNIQKSKNKALHHSTLNRLVCPITPRVFVQERVAHAVWSWEAQEPHRLAAGEAARSIGGAGQIRAITHCQYISFRLTASIGHV